VPARGTGVSVTNALPLGQRDGRPGPKGKRSNRAPTRLGQEWVRPASNTGDDMHRALQRTLALGTVALSVSAIVVAPASATPPPTVTESFISTGVQQEFTVPVGVSSVRVEAIGAAGGNGLGPGSGVGGAGADVVGALPVTAGEVLYVEVAAAGFNGGASGGFSPLSIGGNGGDASDVRTISMGSLGSLESRLLVAAGGGGGGGAFGGAGGVGGNAGNPGTNGSSETFSAGGAAGGAGTLTGGGAGGASCGSGPWAGGGGALGLGGKGGQSIFIGGSGGGGGGGYTGGGGGEGTCDPSPEEGGGGGGGGSSFVFGGATFSSFGAASISTAPSISISYPSPATATPDTSAIAFVATQPLQTVSPPQTLTIANEGGNPLQITGATFVGSTPALATDHPEDFLIGSSSCLGAVVFEASCELTVRFAPQSEGPQTATLQIASNAGAGTTVVTLSGTGGQLPQGPAGPTGPEGPSGTTGPQGPTGTTGVQGPAGETGAGGASGMTGAQGPAGAVGATGAQGSKGASGASGSRGPRGATGKQGPPGPAAVYECHRRRGHGQYEKACFVRLLGVSKALVSATLTRREVLYASGPVGASVPGGPLILKLERPIAGGRYTLTLAYGSGTTRQTITVG
jgi:hypothetical protein